VSTSHSACRNHSCACWNHIFQCRNHICACLNLTAFGNHTLRVVITLYVNKSHSCVLKSHFAHRNYTRACVHHSIRVNITHKSNYYTQSVVLTSMSVIITRIRVNIALYVYKPHSCTYTLHSKITLVRVNITLCVWTTHYACEHQTMRVNYTLCVWTSHYACEHHTMRMNITLCVRTSHYACENHNLRGNITLCV
jgi:hypothetical protein